LSSFVKIGEYQSAVFTDRVGAETGIVANRLGRRRVGSFTRCLQHLAVGGKEPAVIATANATRFTPSIGE